MINLETFLKYFKWLYSNKPLYKKHIESLDSKMIDQKWQIYISIFDNTFKQENIINSKEEQCKKMFNRNGNNYTDEEVERSGIFYKYRYIFE